MGFVDLTARDLLFALHRRLAFSASVTGFKTGLDLIIKVILANRPVHSRFSFPPY